MLEVLDSVFVVVKDKIGIYNFYEYFLFLCIYSSFFVFYFIIVLFIFVVIYCWYMVFIFIFFIVVKYSSFWLVCNFFFILGLCCLLILENIIIVWGN